MQCVTISLGAPPPAGPDGAPPPPPPDAAALSDALFEAGALAVSLTPPSGPPPPKGAGGAAAGAGVGAGVAPIFHEVPPGAVRWEAPPRVVWAGATVTATFAAGVDVEDLLARLAVAQGLSSVPRYVVTPVDEVRDWVAEVQAGFPPVRVGRLLIQYPWHAGGGGVGGGVGRGGEGQDAATHAAAAGGEGGGGGGEPTVVLSIEPGCAFGTGEHPTTRLVLGYLQSPAAAVSGARVLDYGCGSGVLALAAAALGAASVVGVDIDPDAVAVATANAAGGAAIAAAAAVTAVADGAASGVEGGVGPPPPPGRPPHPPPPWHAAALSFVTNADEADEVGAYDVVVANILAKPLVALAPLLRRRAAAGGRLALAGVLAEQGPTVRGAYEEAGWAMGDGQVLDGWVLLTGVAR